MGCPGTGRPGVGREAALGAAAPGAARGALYTGRGPVCGMIILGGGAIEAPDFAGASCICVTLLCAGGCAAGLVARSGAAMAGGAAVELVAAGVVAAGGGAGILGGMRTPVRGRYPARSETGGTILGRGGRSRLTPCLCCTGLRHPSLASTPRLV